MPLYDADVVEVEEAVVVELRVLQAVAQYVEAWEEYGQAKVVVRGPDEATL